MDEKRGWSWSNRSKDVHFTAYILQRKEMHELASSYENVEIGD